MRECKICYSNQKRFISCFVCNNEICGICYTRLVVKKCPFCRRQIGIEDDIDFIFSLDFLDYLSSWYQFCLLAAVNLSLILVITFILLFLVTLTISLLSLVEVI